MSWTMFACRAEAARALTHELRALRGQNPLVLAIPRGAVEMARIVADGLRGEADIVLVKKLTAPSNPEFAIGAIDESGWRWIADYARQAGADARYLEIETQRQHATLRQRRALYTPDRAPIEVRDRTVVIVDDGMATGASMLAALHATRARAPARLICAVPVASREALTRVRSEADEVVCLYSPVNFQAVGQFYQEFPQLDDAKVVALLQQKGPAPDTSPPQS